MRTADEIRDARLREACACAEQAKKKKVSADPPKGDGGIEVQTETFVGRAARAILEGKEEPPPIPVSESNAVASALDRIRHRVFGVSG